MHAPPPAQVSATVLDLAFWPALYGADRAHALPGIHVSVKARALYYKVCGPVHVLENRYSSAGGEEKGISRASAAPPTPHLLLCVPD